MTVNFPTNRPIALQKPETPAKRQVRFGAEIPPAAPSASGKQSTWEILKTLGGYFKHAENKAVWKALLCSKAPAILALANLVPVLGQIAFVVGIVPAVGLSMYGDWKLDRLEKKGVLDGTKGLFRVVKLKAEWDNPTDNSPTVVKEHLKNMLDETLMDHKDYPAITKYREKWKALLDSDWAHKIGHAFKAQKNLAQNGLWKLGRRLGRFGTVTLFKHTLRLPLGPLKWPFMAAGYVIQGGLITKAVRKLSKNLNLKA